MTVSIKQFDTAVQTFKDAWDRADESGLEGHRTQLGIQALINAGWAPQAPNPEVRKSKEKP